jgi:transcriptional regulator with XRE-family HTH domain
MQDVITDKQAVASVAENVRRILDERGLSVNWLVVQLKASPGTIYPIVRGEALPSIGTTARIAEVLGVLVDDLLPEKTSRKIRKTG